MNKTSTIRGTVFVGMLLFALGCFMLFNYVSTLQTLKHILGGDYLVYFFAFALSIVDFAGLARIFTPETDIGKESKLIYILGFVWILACVFDVFMTAYWASLKMVQNDNGAAVSNVMGAAFYKFIPWIIAFGELCLRVPLVLMVGAFGDGLMNGLDRLVPAIKDIQGKFATPIPMRKPTPVPAMRPTQPPPMRSQPSENTYRPITFGDQK